MSRSGLVLAFAGLVVIGLAVALFAARFNDQGDGGRLSTLDGAPVPDLTLPMLEGDGRINLRSIAADHDVLVINFFASWCLQCRNEHGDLVATASAYRDRSVRFVEIAFQDDPARSVAFLDELGRGEDIHYLADPGSRAAIEFGVFGVPETVFVADGSVVAKLLGETDALILSQYLEQLLDGGEVESRQVGDYGQPAY